MTNNKNTDNNQHDLLEQKGQGIATDPIQESENSNSKNKGQEFATDSKEKQEEWHAFFKQYPQAKKYFETADGCKFFNAHDARNYANTLKNKSVNEIKNSI